MQLTFNLDVAAAPARASSLSISPERRSESNGQLFAGHGIERETRGHLGNALGTLGNHDELHDGDDQEDDDAHHEVSARDESDRRSE